MRIHLLLWLLTCFTKSIVVIRGFSGEFRVRRPHQEDASSSTSSPRLPANNKPRATGEKPETKRRIRVGGPTYRKFIEEGGWIQYDGTMKRLDFELLRVMQTEEGYENGDDECHHQETTTTTSSSSSSTAAAAAVETDQYQWHGITPSAVVETDESAAVAASSSPNQRHARRSLTPDETKLLTLHHLLFVDKPSGLHCVPPRRSDDDNNNSPPPSLSDQVACSVANAKPCHRLDRDTSGIVVFGLSPEAHSDISQQFEARTTTKTYLALVAGHPEHDSGRVDRPIGKIQTDRGFARWSCAPHADKRRDAQTDWRVDERFDVNGVKFTRVQLTPRAGRGHQLRLHMRAMGCPILGDTLHCGIGVADCAPRLCLHAWKLQVDWNNLRLEVEAEPPF